MATLLSPEPQLRQRIRPNYDDTPSHDYGSAAAYCEKIRQWVADTQCWNAFHQQNMAQMTSIMQGQAQSGSGFPQGQAAGTIIQLPNGLTTITQSYSTPSLIRRACAELIDFACMFILKIAFVFFLIDLELLDLTPYEKLLGDQADLQTLIDATQDLFPLEIIGKLIASFVEALLLSKGLFAGISGCTPGKAIMGIRVVSAHSIADDPRVFQNITVTGPPTIPFASALLRSLIKNLVVNSLMPLSSVVFVFRHGQSIYDMVSKTIVVNINPQHRVFRRVN